MSTTRFAIIDEEVIPFQELPGESMEPAAPPESYIGLDLLGQHYDIVWAPSTLMSDVYGTCDSTNQQITVRAGLRGMQALDTLFHEITHAISEISGVKLTELQVHTLGYTWGAVLKANPELLQYFADRLDEEYERDNQRRSRKTQS